MSFCLYRTSTSLFKCYSKTVCTTMCALFSSNNPKQHCCRSASCCWSCLECSPRKQRKGSKQLLQRGSLPTVSNRQAVLCRRKPGMVITYKQIRFNSHWTRDNTQYASGVISSVSRLLPSCLLLKLANHKMLHCLIKHAVEHYQKKPFDQKKKAKAIKAIARYLCDHSRSRSDRNCSVPTNSHKETADRGNALHVFALPFWCRLPLCYHSKVSVPENVWNCSF